jgi:hypothetical protein
MNFTSKHIFLIITITILLIFIILCYIAIRFGAFKDFQQDVKNNTDDKNECNLPLIPNNLRYKKKSKGDHYLKWNKVKNIIYYKVYFYKENPLKGTLPYYIGDTSDHHNIAEPILSLPKLKHGNYWFRVRAINGCGEGEFSETISVIV